MLPQFEDFILSRQGVSEILTFEEHFKLQGSTLVKDQSAAIQWQLCVGKLLPAAWRTNFNYSICLNQCNTTWCPQPAQDYLTASKAEACLPASVKWSDVQSCVTASGAAMQKADAALSENDCPGCSGPTVHINGAYAGHHPDLSHVLLKQICGNFTGTKPAGCTIDQFAVWASTHGKAYRAEPLSAEFALRHDAFRASIKRVASLNAAHAPHTTFDLNQFSDLTPTEFTARMHTHRGLSGAGRAHSAAQTPIATTSSFPTPQAWDWSTKQALTPIKNQGDCGCAHTHAHASLSPPPLLLFLRYYHLAPLHPASFLPSAPSRSCWAFSVTETVESAAFLAGQPLVELSPQQLVDCDKLDQACNGGTQQIALDVVKRKGLEKLLDYPYVSGKTGARGARCNYTESNVAAHISGFSYATPICLEVWSCKNQDEAKLAASLASISPISVCLDASKNWQDYKSGVLMGAHCTSPMLDSDHCVQITGMNLSAPVPYWKVRNSWSSTWGEEGYIRLEYGTNTCGVANTAIVVDIAKMDDV
jgi:hypothetical protein